MEGINPSLLDLLDLARLGGTSVGLLSLLKFRHVVVIVVVFALVTTHARHTTSHAAHHTLKSTEVGHATGTTSAATKLGEVYAAKATVTAHAAHTLHTAAHAAGTTHATHAGHVVVVLGNGVLLILVDPLVKKSVCVERQ